MIWDGVPVRTLFVFVIDDRSSSPVFVSNRIERASVGFHDEEVQTPFIDDLATKQSLILDRHYGMKMNDSQCPLNNSPADYCYFCLHSLQILLAHTVFIPFGSTPSTCESREQRSRPSWRYGGHCTIMIIIIYSFGIKLCFIRRCASGYVATSCGIETV